MKQILGFRRLPGKKIACENCGKVLWAHGNATSSHRRAKACKDFHDRLRAAAKICVYCKQPGATERYRDSDWHEGCADQFAYDTAVDAELRGAWTP